MSALSVRWYVPLHFGHSEGADLGRPLLPTLLSCQYVRLPKRLFSPFSAPPTTARISERVFVHKHHFLILTVSADG